MAFVFSVTRNASLAMPLRMPSAIPERPTSQKIATIGSIRKATASATARPSRIENPERLAELI